MGERGKVRANGEGLPQWPLRILDLVLKNPDEVSDEFVGYLSD